MKKRVVRGAVLLGAWALAVGALMPATPAYADDSSGPYTVSYDVDGIGSTPDPRDSGWGAGSAGSADVLGAALNVIPIGNRNDNYYPGNGEGQGGWYMDKDRTIPASYQTQLTGNTTVYYKWAKATAIIDSVEVNVVATPGTPYPENVQFMNPEDIAQYISVPDDADYEVVWMSFEESEDTEFIVGHSYPLRFAVVPKASGDVFKGHASAVINEDAMTGAPEWDKSKCFTTTINGVSSSDFLEGCGAKMTMIEYNLVLGEDLVPIYRMYDGVEHLYVNTTVERDALVKRGWKYEGVAFYTPKVSSTEVHRLFQPATGDHHYTSDPVEIAGLTEKHGWKDEGVLFYGDDLKRVPLTRLFKPGLGKGEHLHTADANELKALTEKHGWKEEGTSFFVAQYA